jgi:hypothetical protein
VLITTWSTPAASAARRVLGHCERTLVVHERELEDEGVGTGVRRRERRAVGQVGAGGAAERADGITGAGEMGGDGGSLAAGRSVDGDGLGSYSTANGRR